MAGNKELQEKLRAKIKAVVQEFMDAEGGVTIMDLYAVMGQFMILTALADLPISFSPLAPEQ